MSPARDVVVVGAGFGGLSAALELAARGREVALCEALAYPGGCASTFERAGYRFEAGATLFAGFDPGQLFARWIERHGLDVRLDRPDPVIELRTPDLRLAIPRRRAELVERLASLPGAPRGVRSFLDEAGRAADVLWDLLDDLELLPPLGLRALARHAARLPRWAPLVRRAGKPLAAVLESHGVARFAPLRTWVDAACQITVQCTADRAEAPFALAALDYPWRGAAHVRGGIGELAAAVVGALRALGAEVRMPWRVDAIERAGGELWLRGPRGELRARRVVANLLPQDLRRLLGLSAGAAPELDRRARAVEGGWGACALYSVLCPPAGDLPDGPLHLQLVRDPSAPLTEGNHVFASISGADEAERAPAGMRVATVSTHVPLRELAAAGERAGERVRGIHERMRETLRALAPEWYANVVYEDTASPRTFERFTGRAGGLVGGVPRTAGLASYRRLAPRAALPGVYLVGDSVFPGQSALAAAVGGERLARTLAGPRRRASARPLSRPAQHGTQPVR